MSKPGRKRVPRGDARGGSVADKDDQAVRSQRAEKADLIARMRRRTEKTD